ncbi:MAG: SpoIIE family protein phosphatase [Lachnospiraceae bacterium]|nr:SpoIIE family protein phosphatase [Lachnospiraceae bacterium]
MIIRLLMPALGVSVLVYAMYTMEKLTSFKKLPYKVKQIIWGVVFGCMAMYASDHGVEIDGAVMNVRDAGPLCAGLIFGAPAGVIAGVLGGTYRWFSVFWGAGTYSRVACSVATCLAGIIAAGLRKKMFDDKRPSWLYGLGIGMVVEVFHMLLIFLTNMKDAANAFNLVQQCTIPMVVCNSAAVGLSLLGLSLFRKEKVIFTKEQQQISQTFQNWLLIYILIGFFVTSWFTYSLQNGVLEVETKSVLETNIEDVNNSIKVASDENLLYITQKIAADYEREKLENITYVELLALRYSVSDVNVVDENGIIVLSNVPEFIGFDMNSGEQSKEFVDALKENDCYVQEYQPLSYNSEIGRKYAAVKLSNGGFIQVGYNYQRFHKDIEEQVVAAARYRHVGNSGFIFICNEEGKIIVNNDIVRDTTLEEIGFGFNPEKTQEMKVYEGKIYEKDYFYAYTYTEGFYIIGVIPKSEAVFTRDVSTYVSVFMEVLIFATLFVQIYYLVKGVVIDNIKKINISLAKITQGDLNVTVDVRSNEEFASLSDDINSTVDTLKRYIAEAAARIDKELEFARSIQSSSLPSVFPPFPKEDSFDIYAQMYTAKEVGGDFYDFYMINDYQIAFVIADVSGKGIPAAMFMMRAKTSIKDLAEGGLDVGSIFTKANNGLCENNEAGMFVTAWIGILDLKTGVVKFANAGHNPPMIRKANGEFVYMKSRAGLVLAGMEDIPYMEQEMQLEPGDRIFLYTDGVTEANDIDGKLYSEERLERFINSVKEEKAEDVLNAIKGDIDLFADEAPQFDDITMLMLDFKKYKA